MGHEGVGWGVVCHVGVGWGGVGWVKTQTQKIITHRVLKIHKWI